MLIDENKPYYYIEKENGGCNVILQVKELYELAKEHNAENREIEIGAYDEDGWYDEFGICTEGVLFNLHEGKVCIAL